MSQPAHERVLYVAGPAAAWAVRPPAVVDCSVLSALLWAEPAAAEARSRVAGYSLHAPSLLRYELANVGRNKARSGVPPDEARAGVEAFTELTVVLRDVEPMRLFDIAQRLSLTAYDAAYLCLAAELGAPLITFDRQLAQAAARLLGGSGTPP